MQKDITHEGLLNIQNVLRRLAYTLSCVLYRKSLIKFHNRLHNIQWISLFTDNHVPWRNYNVMVLFIPTFNPLNISDFLSKLWILLVIVHVRRYQLYFLILKVKCATSCLAVVYPCVTWRARSQGAAHGRVHLTKKGEKKWEQGGGSAMWQSDAVGPSSDGHRYYRFRWVRKKAPYAEERSNHTIY